MNKKQKRRPSMFRILLVVIVVFGLLFFVYDKIHPRTIAPSVTSTVTKNLPDIKAQKTQSTPAQASYNPCKDNTLDKLIIVSISARHLWACEQSQIAKDTPVITGMSFLAADLTPTGTFYIDSKQRDLNLRGSDSTGSWDDPVKYWMPFLYNQYGTYGFHDATWRDPSEFGNVSPDSDKASHGCVELPLTASAWLFNWALVGTKVSIVS